MPVFAGEDSLDREALWWCHSGNQAIRMGDWKLSMAKGGKWELYNLKEDRSEMNNLANKHPDKLKELAKKWEAIAEGFRKDLKIK